MRRIFTMFIAAILLVIALAIPTMAKQDHKVTICHHTGSESNPTVTITVDTHAWPAHEKHGDTLGACPVVEPTPEPTVEPTVEPTIEPTPAPTGTIGVPETGTPEPTLPPTDTE